MNKFVISVFLFCYSMYTYSQKEWTLRECVTYALENNISVKQSELDIELAEIDKKDALGNYLPTLNGFASNSWNTGLTQNVTTGVLETQTSRNSSYGISAGVDIFRGLQNIRASQRAKLNQLAASYNLDKMKDDIALLVANAYLQILLNKANLEVIRSQNQVTLQQLERTNNLVDAGVLPRGDLLEIKATDASEKQQIAVAENAVTISRISLAQLLLVDDYANFDITEDEFEIIDESIALKDVSEIIASAKQTRSEILIAETNLDIAQKDLQVARGSYYPSITGFFNYNTREADSNRFDQIVDPDNPTISTEIGVVQNTGEVVVATIPNTIIQELPPLPYFEQLYLNDGISYGVQMNVPIFNGFAARNNVKRSQVNIKRQEYLLEQARLDLESNVYQAYVDVKGALKSFEAAQQALESQELAFEYAKERYDVGLTNAFDFSQAKVRYDNTRIEVNRAKYDYIFKLKVLELYFGIPVSELKF